MTHDDPPAEVFEMRDESVGGLLGTTAREYPSDAMRHRPEDEREPGGQGVVERQHSMGGNAAEQRARPLLDNMLRASPSAERSARSPNAANASGCRGHVIGPSTDRSMRDQLAMSS